MTKNLKLGIMMFLQYAVWGAWMPVTSRFLTASVMDGGLGFTDSQMAIILGFAASIGALSAPFIAGQVADRYFSTEKILAFLVISGGLVKWYTALQTDFNAWLYLSILYSILYMPTLALSNSIAFAHLEDSENNFPKNLKVRILDKDALSSAKAVKLGALRAVSANIARTLGNTPANDMNPGKLAEEAKNLCKTEGLKYKVIEEKEMQKLGMGMLLGVSQGSITPAKLIFMEYRHPEAKDTLAVVGKGVTFDSGGISLKPGKSMDEMKFDMCGSAAVLGAMNAVAKIKPKLNVIGVVPATENLPGGNAQRPGDIVTAYNGKKVEILNTDAEGRLILGDALSYTIEKYNPVAVVDLATLTGACVVALGHHATGALSNHSGFMERIRQAGEKSGDRVWELPNFPEYGELLKGKYGDLQNIGGPAGGTITGGKFLQHFVGDTPWVHLDIAGTAWNVKYVDYHPANGATGVGVRLLIDLISDWQPLN